MNIPGHDERIFRTPEDDICDMCDGKGMIDCPDCDGSGLNEDGTEDCVACEGGKTFECPQCGADA